MNHIIVTVIVIVLVCRLQYALSHSHCTDIKQQFDVFLEIMGCAKVAYINELKNVDYVTKIVSDFF